MSGQPEEVELPPSGDAAFASLMDALAPEADGAAEPPAAGAGDGAATPAGAPARTGGTADVAPTAGAPVAGAEADAPGGGADAAGASAADSGTPGAGGGAGGGEAPAGGGDRPAAWTASATELSKEIGQYATKIEERTLQAYQGQALDEVRTEYAKYFEALEKHPRLLVGATVPSMVDDSDITLRDTADAREWQDMAKSVLVEEVQSRASKALDENADFLTSIHSSIELFQKNSDLIPGTKEFDVELANQFTTLAQPYELVVDGKLQGYSIPVQPIIDQLRSRLVADRAAAAAAPPSTAPAAGQGASTPPAPAAAPEAAASAPQAGIQAKAGAGSEAEDFSALFGTIGLPNFQI